MLIFSDALINCYSAAVYLRSFDRPSGKTNLFFAKTRLVPANKGKSKCKKLTIPRLELMATLIGVCAANFVTRVENRIKEIQFQKNTSFCYIASSQNPSDYATRGLSIADIKECSLWWHGPDWLGNSRSEWSTCWSLHRSCWIRCRLKHKDLK